MRDKAFKLAIAIFFGAAAFGQPGMEQELERAYHFTNTPSATGFQEVATVLRTVGDIRRLTIDAPSAEITIRGKPGEIVMAQWLLHELDQPARAQNPDQGIRDLATHEYRSPGSADNVLRVFYLKNTVTASGIQEMITVLRTVARINKVFQYTPPGVLAVRGSTGEIRMSAWIIQELEQAAARATAGQPSANTGVHEYRVPGGSSLVRVFYSADYRAPKQLIDMASLLRTSTGIQRAFADVSAGVLVAFGTPDQIAQAAKVLEQRAR